MGSNAARARAHRTRRREQRMKEDSRRCAVCGTPLIARRTDARFCSDKCRVYGARGGVTARRNRQRPGPLYRIEWKDIPHTNPVRHALVWRRIDIEEVKDKALFFSWPVNNLSGFHIAAGRVNRDTLKKYGCAFVEREGVDEPYFELFGRWDDCAFSKPNLDAYLPLRRAAQKRGEKRRKAEDQAWLRLIGSIKQSSEALEHLGLSGAPTRDGIINAFREKAKNAHPDRGGNADAFRQLVEARDKALAGVE